MEEGERELHHVPEGVEDVAPLDAVRERGGTVVAAQPGELGEQARRDQQDRADHHRRHRLGRGARRKLAGPPRLARHDLERGVEDALAAGLQVLDRRAQPLEGALGLGHRPRGHEHARDVVHDRAVDPGLEQRRGGAERDQQRHHHESTQPIAAEAQQVEDGVHDAILPSRGAVGNEPIEGGGRRRAEAAHAPSLSHPPGGEKLARCGRPLMQAPPGPPRHGHGNEASGPGT